VIHSSVYDMAASKRICITVDEETLRLANREARRLTISRNEFIRAAVRAEVKNATTQLIKK
jgi:metal-responsive CopG/Arc/MetJ family transcriptional regulator